MNTENPYRRGSLSRPLTPSDIENLAGWLDEALSASDSAAEHTVIQVRGDALIALVDMVTERQSTAETTQAEEPVEWRMARAFVNGYREGLERGMRGRLDHS